MGGRNKGVYCNVENLRVLPYRHYKNDMLNNSGYIYFIDEDFEMLKTVEFSNLINVSDNYFVIVSRKLLSSISVDSSYELKSSMFKNICVVKFC